MVATAIITIRNNRDAFHVYLPDHGGPDQVADVLGECIPLCDAVGINPDPGEIAAALMALVKPRIAVRWEGGGVALVSEHTRRKADNYYEVKAAGGELRLKIRFGPSRTLEGLGGSRLCVIRASGDARWLPEGGPPSDRRFGEDDPDRVYAAASRGWGGDFTPGCFFNGSVNGGSDKLRANLSFMVPSRETGEALVSLFGRGAYLDFRPQEPNWIQVKVGADPEHAWRLVALELAMDKRKMAGEQVGISRSMLDAILAAEEPRERDLPPA